MLHFSRYLVSDGTSLSIHFPAGVPTCGVYVLEFTDGTEYVGQSVSLLSRFTTHRRRWPGEIVGVRFVPLPASMLNEVERDTIAQRVAEGARLRNVDLVALPLRSEVLDLVVDPAVQDEWLSGQVDPVVIGYRGTQAAQRRRTLAKYRQLAEHDDFEKIVTGLASYIGSCIPWPHQTECGFWVVTSLPLTSRSKDRHRLAVVSINNVETLVLAETLQDDGQWATGGFMNIALTAQLPEEFANLVEPSNYRSTGDVHRLRFELDDLTDFLDEESIANGARELSIGLLRKGKGMFARFHDYNLADDIFIELDRALVANR